MLNSFVSKKFKLSPKYQNLILLPITLVIILIICVLILGFNLDKNYILTHVSGYITDNYANPINNVTVCISENCTITSENGFYSLNNINIGEKVLNISSLQYNDINQKIQLIRGQNSVDISLTKAPVTNVIINFASGEILNLDQLKILINNKPYEVTLSEDKKEASLEINDIKIGNYNLKIKSNYYLEQETELAFEANSLNLFTISLQPKAFLTIKTVNWLDNTPLGGVSINLNKREIAKSDISGEAVISNISVQVKKLELKKEGYLPKTITLEELNPGINQTQVIELIPEKKLVFTKPMTTGNQIFISNYDGTELKQLTTIGNNSNPWLDEKNKRVYFRKQKENSRDEIYYVDYYGEELELISSTKQLPERELDIIDYKNDVRYYLTSSELGNKYISSSNLVDNSEKELLNIQKYTLEDFIIGEKGDKFILNIKTSNLVENNIYLMTPDNKKITKLSKYIPKAMIPQALSSDNKYMALLDGKDIYIYSFSNRKLAKLTTDSQEKSKVNFLPNSYKLVFLSNEHDIWQIKFLDSKNNLEVPVTPENITINSYKIISNSIIGYVSNNQSYLISLKNLNSPQFIGEDIIF